MTDMKELALRASEDAFKDGIKTAATMLVTNLILAKTDEEHASCIERHRTALRLWKTAHEATVAAINEILA